MLLDYGQCKRRTYSKVKLAGATPLVAKTRPVVE